MDGDDPMKMADELGDVLLQVVLNSCIGAEPSRVHGSGCDQHGGA